MEARQELPVRKGKREEFTGREKNGKVQNQNNSTPKKSAKLTCFEVLETGRAMAAWEVEIEPVNGKATSSDGWDARTIAPQTSRSRHCLGGNNSTDG